LSAIYLQHLEPSIPLLLQYLYPYNSGLTRMEYGVSAFLRDD
jgi:hypothetical protein